MPSSEQTKPDRRRLVVVGSVVGALVLLCGFGGLGVAALGGYWWSQQPVRLHLPDQPLVAQGPQPIALPTPLVERRMGEPAASTEPVQWTVTPGSLGQVQGDRFTPSAPGDGQAEACVEEVCASVSVSVQIADDLQVSPARFEARVWRPTPLQAEASWQGLRQELPVTWTSSDPAVVTVDDKGVATPVGPGTAELRAAGGGASGSMSFRVFAQPPDPCTLQSYADALGRVGERSETKVCQPGSDEFCEWTASQHLADGSRLDEGGGWEWGWATLLMPSTDLDLIWSVAQKCMNLPPEIAALPMTDLLSGPQKGTRWVPIGGVDTDRAKVQFSRGSVQIELPSDCSDTRSIQQEGRWTKLTVSSGC